MSRHGRLKPTAAAMLASMAAAPAWAAECSAEIQRVQSKAANVADPKVKRLVQYDITRAKKEAGESDGMECQEAIDHADKLLASRAPTP